ncbi:hypothetical protein WKK05_16505 [Nostoc sp. UHCC 0302]|uniref:hypothetical protein n=1 Tax=Nostoc sp. UHCC 0302 TaxID=3134896 RepID=UPI00311C9403
MKHLKSVGFNVLNRIRETRGRGKPAPWAEMLCGKDLGQLVNLKGGANDSVNTAEFRWSPSALVLSVAEVAEVSQKRCPELVEGSGAEPETLRLRSEVNPALYIAFKLGHSTAFTCKLL